MVNDLNIDSDWVVTNFVDFFKMLRKGGEHQKAVTERKYSLRELNISARVLNSWYKKNILTDDRINGKGWSKFSLSELIWIGIIKKLRSFGLNINKIKKVKDYIDSFNLEGSPSKFTLIDFYLGMGYYIQTPIKLIIFSNGDALFSRQIALDKALQEKKIEGNYISIDLLSLVSNLISDIPNSTDYLNYSLSNLEKEIKDSLKEKETSSVNIRVKKDKYLIEKEIVTTNRTKAKKIQNLNNYSEETEIKSGKDKSYKVKVKKRIKK